MKFVGLSNKLDREFVGRKPEKGPHREVVGAAIVDGKLVSEVVEGKRYGKNRILVFSVAAFDLVVVARGIRTDALVSDTQRRGSVPKRVGIALWKLEKRLVHSKPLSVWTHKT